MIQLTLVTLTGVKVNMVHGKTQILTFLETLFHQALSFKLKLFFPGYAFCSQGGNAF